MRRLLPGLLAFGVFALVVFLAFGVEPAAPDTAPTPAPTAPAPVTAAVPPAAPAKTTERVESPGAAGEELIALRRYEHLLNGRRYGVFEVQSATRRATARASPG